MIGHEEGVHKVLLSVERLVETGEAELNLVLSRLEVFLRDDDVLVPVGGECLATLALLTGIVVEGAVEAALEIEHHVGILIHLEGDDVLARHLLVDVGRNVETEVVEHVADVGIPILCKHFGNPFR